MSPFAAPLLVALAQASAAPPAPAAPAAPAAAVAEKPAPAGPYIVIDTNFGKITVGLYQDLAPISVKNFLGYVRGGFYDGTIFHRVIANFMIQGGGYDKDLTELPARAPIRNEARNTPSNKRGTLAMARTNEPNSATSQFFINLKDNHRLDFGIGGAGYAVFGEVVSGMEVVDKIAGVATGPKGGHQTVPSNPVTIRSVRETAAPKKPQPPAEAPAAPTP
jgi:cyclophilin family peptidyl-prolyl cis-trans isomerase